jgi:hypothetical protein
MKVNNIEVSLTLLISYVVPENQAVKEEANVMSTQEVVHNDERLSMVLPSFDGNNIGQNWLREVENTAGCYTERLS